MFIHHNEAYHHCVIKIKRAYETANKKDGYRVLVDRMWPRGIKKEELIYDEWAKELAPSKELLQYFKHETDKWKNFQLLYKKELRSKETKGKIELLVQRALRGSVTLVYSAKDEKHNNAIILEKVISRIMKKNERT